MKTLRSVAWITLLACAAIQGWVYRHDVSPDGVAYLDLSDAVVRVKFGELVNGYWSPAYPFIVGSLRVALAATPFGAAYWEFAILHLATFLGFVLSLAAFERFLRAVTLAGASWRQRPFASPFGRALAYAFFGVASLSMISVRGTLPDFYLSAATFLAFACLLRLQDDPSDRAAALQLGAVLAFGALTKSFFFPFGAVVLATLALVVWRRGYRMRLSEAAAVFILLTVPWVVALSLSLGKPSTGETGRLNYAWYVNDIQPHNSGVMPVLAAPRTPLPLPGVGIFVNARGTNPLWYDPVRWHRDVQPRFSVPQQMRRLWWSVRYYIYVTAPLLLLLCGIAVAAKWRDVQTTVARTWVLLLPTLAAYAAYALVYTTSRYVAPFLVASCLALAAAFPWGAELRAGRFGVAAGLVMLVLHLVAPLRGMETITAAFALAIAAWVGAGSSPLLVRLALATIGGLVAISLPALSPSLRLVLPFVVAAAAWLALSHSERTMVDRRRDLQVLAIGFAAAWAAPALLFSARALSGINAAGTVAHPEWQVVGDMRRLGVAPGSRVALLGNPDNVGWARLMRVQVVGVVPGSQIPTFAALSAADRDRVLQAFAAAGAARLVVQPARATSAP